METKNELKGKKGIEKVIERSPITAKKALEMQKDAKKITVSDAIKKELANINTEAKVKQSAKKVSSIWNLQKIRDNEMFKTVKHSSDSTVRNAVRKEQERICNKILDNAKNSKFNALESDFKDLELINLFLNDPAIFANHKRSNYKDLQLAYQIYSDNKDKLK